MISTLIAIGIGSVAFIVGMNTQKRADKGESCGDLIKNAALDTAEIVGGAVWTCYDTARKLVTGDNKDQHSNYENKQK